jgi:hypothetical protein
MAWRKTGKKHKNKNGEKNMNRNNPEDIKIFEIPVERHTESTILIKAHSLEEAIAYINEKSDGKLTVMGSQGETNRELAKKLKKTADRTDGINGKPLSEYPPNIIAEYSRIPTPSTVTQSQLWL